MANALRNRLLQAIAADVAARERDDAAHDIAAVNLRGDEQRWDHLITNFFRHDEMALFTDRRLDRGVFNVLLNAIKDLRLQTRGRRSFAHSHREQLLVVRGLPAFGTRVRPLLVAPAPRSKSATPPMEWPIPGRRLKRGYSETAKRPIESA